MLERSSRALASRPAEVRVYAREPADLDLYPGLLAHLAPERREEILAEFHLSAGRFPAPSFALDQQNPASAVGDDARDGDHVARVAVGHGPPSTLRPMRAARDAISCCGIFSTPLLQLVHAPCCSS